MKKNIKQFADCLPVGLFCFLLFAIGNNGYAQDSTAATKQAGKVELARNTFLGNLKLAFLSNLHCGI